MGFEYSKKVMKNFLEPKNIGEMKNPDGEAEVGNAACGDIMNMQVKINDKNEISDIKFRTFGCAAAIATTSIITQMVKGKSIEYAENLSMKDVAENLNGLPPIKMHCSTMGIQTLGRVIKDYKIKNGIIPKPDNWSSKEAESEHKH